MFPLCKRKLLYWSMFLEEMSGSLLCCRSPVWLGYLCFGCLYKTTWSKRGIKFGEEIKMLKLQVAFSRNAKTEKEQFIIYNFYLIQDWTSWQKNYLGDWNKFVFDDEIQIIHYIFSNILGSTMILIAKQLNMPNKEKQIWFYSNVKK